eukprot:5503813-Prymnesium_polylepis.2
METQPNDECSADYHGRAPGHHYSIRRGGVRIFLLKFDYATSTQEGTVPHQDKPAGIPWPAMCCACAVLCVRCGRVHSFTCWEGTPRCANAA